MLPPGHYNCLLKYTGLFNRKLFYRFAFKLLLPCMNVLAALHILPRALSMLGSRLLYLILRCYYRANILCFVIALSFGYYWIKLLDVLEVSYFRIVIWFLLVDAYHVIWFSSEAEKTIHSSNLYSGLFSPVQFPPHPNSLVLYALICFNHP